jgi:hypothetical protein
MTPLANLIQYQTPSFALRAHWKGWIFVMIAAGLLCLSSFHSFFWGTPGPSDGVIYQVAGMP